VPYTSFSYTPTGATNTTIVNFDNSVQSWLYDELFATLVTLRESAAGQQLFEEDIALNVTMGVGTGTFFDDATNTITLDLASFLDASYYDFNGNSHQTSVQRVFIHELVHATIGFDDLWSGADPVHEPAVYEALLADPSGDFIGDTVAATNFIMSSIFSEAMQSGYHPVSALALDALGIDTDGQFIDQTVSAFLYETRDVLIDRTTSVSRFGGSSPESALIIGGEGAETVLAGDGHDYIFTQGGDDQIFGGPGDDHIFGGEGNDNVLGGAGRDSVAGGLGADWLVGGDGEVVGTTISPLEPDNQADYLVGGEGTDTYVMTGEVAGGPSINTISMTKLRALVNFTIDTIYDADELGTIRHQYGVGPTLNNELEYDAYESFVNSAQYAIEKNVPPPLATSASTGLEILYNTEFVSGLDVPPYEAYGVVSGSVTLNMRSLTNPSTESEFAIMLGGYGGAAFMEYHTPLYAIEVAAQSEERVAAATMNLVDPLFYIGDETNETISGTELDDAMYGGSGDDDIVGNDGSDFARGDGGHDVLAGGAGHDVLSGDAGADSVAGGDDDDWLLGGTDDDTLEGGAGFDELDGEDGDDSLDGGDDSDLLIGGDGDDTLQGGAGGDRLFGDAGDDTLAAGAGYDTIDGGEGSDTAVFDGDIGDFTITEVGDGSVQVSGNGEIDFVTGVEVFQFDDGTVPHDAENPWQAEGDRAWTEADTPIVIDVLDNDALPTGANPTVSTGMQPANGTVSWNGTEYTYTPNTAFTGVDYFTYDLLNGANNDQYAGTSGYVMVYVGGTPDPNDMTGIAGEVDGGWPGVSYFEGTSFNDTVNFAGGSGNYVDGGEGDDRIVFEGDAGDYEISAQGDYYHVTNTSTGGSVQFTSIEYLKFDDTADVSLATIITNAGRQPGAFWYEPQPISGLVEVESSEWTATDDRFWTDADTPIVVNVNANDTVPSGADVNTYIWTQPQHGSIAWNGTGYTYTPDTSFTGLDWFSYGLHDADNGDESKDGAVAIVHVGGTPDPNDTTGITVDVGDTAGTYASGTDFDDTVNFLGGEANYVETGAGNDRIVFEGDAEDYEIIGQGEHFVITNISTGEGVQFRQVEYIQFDDDVDIPLTTLIANAGQQPGAYWFEPEPIGGLV